MLYDGATPAGGEIASMFTSLSAISLESAGPSVEQNWRLKRLAV